MSETTPNTDEPKITRHREGEHRAGVPEGRDESEVETTETGVGREGIDALPEPDRDADDG